MALGGGFGQNGLGQGDQGGYGQNGPGGYGQGGFGQGGFNQGGYGQNGPGGYNQGGYGQNGPGGYNQGGFGQNGPAPYGGPGGQVSNGYGPGGVNGGGIGNPHNQMPEGRKVFDGALLLISAIGGILGGIIAMLLYDLLISRIESRPLVVMLSVAGFFLVFGLVIIIAQSLIRGTYRTGTNMGFVILLFLVSAAVIAGLSFLFEFLYEDRGTFVNKAGPTSYIFMIDDSSSMTWDDRDPNRKRYDAVDMILQNKPSSFPYAVYSFSDSAKCIRPFAPKGDSTNVKDLAPAAGAGTNYQAALITLYDDFASGVINDRNMPRILFLSDGDYDFPVDEQIQPFIDMGVAISTVGLASEKDSPTFEKLQEMAAKTGGTYAYVDDIDMLASEMGAVISTGSNRDLLTERTGAGENDSKYALLRILFMSLIGFLAGAAVALFGGVEEKLLPILTSLGTGIAGGVILELGLKSKFFRNLSLPIPGGGQRLADYLYFLLIALTFAMMIKGVSHGLPSQNLSMGGGMTSQAKGFGQDFDNKNQGPTKTFGNM